MFFLLNVRTYIQPLEIKDLDQTSQRIEHTIQTHSEMRYWTKNRNWPRDNESCGREQNKNELLLLLLIVLIIKHGTFLFFQQTLLSSNKDGQLSNDKVSNRNFLHWNIQFITSKGRIKIRRNANNWTLFYLILMK